MIEKEYMNDSLYRNGIIFIPDNMPLLIVNKNDTIEYLKEKISKLQRENMKLKEDYSELENKYKNMERNFYDAFS